MKKIILLLSLIITSISINAQNIHSKAYGNPNDKPIIFLHGGPGYNSVSFEMTTAQILSESGYYVIVYDRRGEGRSIDKDAEFTFQETFEDLNLIYEKYDLEKASILGHSFGGVVGTLYAEKYPHKINSIILVGAPVSMQETLLNILKSSEKIYKEKNDTNNLKYIDMLKNMDPKSLEYSSYCFAHAMQNGFYFAKEPSQEALGIYTKMKTDALFSKYGSQMSYNAPQGFWRNENYTSINLTQSIKDLIKKDIQIFGIYGTDDGLFSTEQTLKLKNLIGQPNFEHLENCSHNVFIDQQSKFINLLKAWIR